MYTFVNTTYLDNGVKFTCLANKVYSSEQTSMNVYCKRYTQLDHICMSNYSMFYLLYFHAVPPIFDYDQMTVLKYFNTGQDSSIQCTVKYCNPSVYSLRVFNTSRDTSNIEVHYIAVFVHAHYPWNCIKKQVKTVCIWYSTMCVITFETKKQISFKILNTKAIDCFIWFWIWYNFV